MRLDVFTSLELQALDGIHRRLSGAKGSILDEIGVYMIASITKTFESEGRPEKWASLKPATLKMKKGNMILHEAGLLKAATTHWVEGDSVYIGPSGPASVYSRIQHLGGRTGRGHKVTIPARPVYVVQDEDNHYIVQATREYVLDG